jgi:hypothetical protein
MATESLPVRVAYDLPFSSKPPKKWLKSDHNEKGWV